MSRRATRLQALVMPVSLRLLPLESSPGKRPRKAMSWRGLSKRRMSPISATIPAATVSATPRNAWSADGTKRPFRHERLDLLLDEILAFERLIHGIEVSLEGDLLCGMGEVLIGKPDTVLLFQTAPA